jgi:2-oxoglutarate ferredoxin oxidoreductase subunit alpha
MAMEAFDLAERFQTPIFVMSDLDLGMNNWMAEPLTYPVKPLDRGKVLDEEALKRIGEFGRYQDVDGDGIPYRTIPGGDMPAYFCRGSGHNERGQYSERPDDYVHNIDRLARKFETARQWVPRPIVEVHPDAEIGIIAFGTSHWAVVESRDQLKFDADINTSYLRVRAYPFTSELATFIAHHERVYVVEQNRDAQLLSLMKLELPAAFQGKLRSVRHYTGLPIDARSVTDEILTQEGHELVTRPAERVYHGTAGVGGE